jgi:hypothetical protein
MNATTRGLILATFLATGLFTGQAMADKITLKSNIAAAREKVVAMISGQGEPAVLKADIEKLSSSVDGEVDSVAGLKPIWEKFKTNRDTKIIPAFDGHHPDGKEAAKSLAMGEQKELYGKMMDLLK